jgi:phosphopantothenoylcysteine synthetase/decarboxylase
VVPATFNTVNKWAAGISDTFALGVLNEAIGLKLPIIVAPYAKPSLAAHPAFRVSLEKLNGWGVNVLSNEAIRVKAKEQDAAMDVDDKSAPRFSWRPVIEAVIRIL